MTFFQLFTLFHTALSIVAVTAGLFVVKGLISSAGRQLWTLLFLVSAAATTLTGFLFPFEGITSALVLGAISIVPISLAFLARYRYRQSGPWRGTYVICAVITLYFNCVVLIVQAFQKIPSLNALAPTASERPVQITQLLIFALFVVLGWFAFKNYERKTSEDISDSYISPRIEAE